MKLKEVCTQTGLTQKTVRFYEEKSLIIPNSIIKNGRSYRDYTQDNVKALQEIAILRKALFSLEEIYLMQQDPEEIPVILKEYGKRVTALASTLASLSAAANSLNVHRITDISQLAEAMESATKPLPLPPLDLRPSFKHLDQLEAEERIRLQQDQVRRRGESPFFLEQQKFTNRLGLFHEHYKHNSALSAGTSNYPKPEEPRHLRYVNFILTGIILLLTLTVFYFLLQHKVERVALWHSMREWIISLDLVLIAIRLLTAPVYGILHRIRKNNQR